MLISNTNRYKPFSIFTVVTIATQIIGCSSQTGSSGATTGNGNQPCVPECLNGGGCVDGYCECSEPWRGGQCTLLPQNGKIYHFCISYFLFVCFILLYVSIEFEWAGGFCVCSQPWRGEQCTLLSQNSKIFNAFTFVIDIFVHTCMCMLLWILCAPMLKYIYSLNLSGMECYINRTANIL